MELTQIFISKESNIFLVQIFTITFIADLFVLEVIYKVEIPDWRNWILLTWLKKAMSKMMPAQLLLAV